jgi:protein-S-isoprenylcysteine O-methyltransferase Ste14
VSRSPKENPFPTTSFVIHSVRGVIRDQSTRRKTMLVLLVIAFVLLFSGSTFLQSALDPHGHRAWFVLFWLVCALLTLTAILLALFDLLMLKSEGRKHERILRENFLDSVNRDSPRSRTGE